MSLDTEIPRRADSSFRNSICFGKRENDCGRIRSLGSFLGRPPFRCRGSVVDGLFVLLSFTLLSFLFLVFVSFSSGCRLPRGVADVFGD